MTAYTKTADLDKFAMSIQPAKFQTLDGSGQAWQPQRVLFFSEHLLDAPHCDPPRYPPEKKAALAAQCISDKLDKLQVGPSDLAIAQQLPTPPWRPPFNSPPCPRI